MFVLTDLFFLESFELPQALFYQNPETKKPG
jgi:hypothetical protein